MPWGSATCTCSLVIALVAHIANAERADVLEKRKIITVMNIEKGSLVAVNWNDIHGVFECYPNIIQILFGISTTTERRDIDTRNSWI